MLRKERIFGWLWLPIHAALLPAALSALCALLGLTDGGTVNAIYYALSLTVILLAFGSYFSVCGKILRGGFWLFVQAVILGAVLYFVLDRGLQFAQKLCGIRVPLLNDETVRSLLRKDALPMAFCVLIAAPVVEETLFRGVVFGSLCRRSRILAYAVSALLFSLLHVRQYLTTADLTALAVNAVGYLPAGIALAWTYQKSGSIFAPMVLHTAVNAFWFFREV